MAKTIFNNLFATAINANFFDFPFATNLWYKSTQDLLRIEACKLHIYNFFLTKGFPILLIFLVPFTLVPEDLSVGANPKYDANYFEESKFLNPSVEMINNAAVRSPIPAIDFMLLK